MDLSYWEIKSWFSDVDVTIVGSGITGLHAALRLRERFPAANILILEKGALPEGASTKNAGFACFGSLSEIVDDLKTQSPEDVMRLIAKRRQGLEVLRNRLGDNTIGLEPNGGYELFETADSALLEECLAKREEINAMLRSVFGADVFKLESNRFGFANILPTVIFNAFEAQIDTGKMMQALLLEAYRGNILILNRQEVTSHEDLGSHVQVGLGNFSFRTGKLLWATNGFAKELTGGDVNPARAQVLVTSPIPDLKIKGTFHLDRGYYYFRNIDNRILLGGGRNLDFEGETTTAFGHTELIQDRLEKLLKEVILPDVGFTIEQRWSGIMGMGKAKSPVIKALSDNVGCGVRLGGMGIAIGSLVGRELADLF